MNYIHFLSWPLNQPGTFPKASSPRNRNMIYQRLVQSILVCLSIVLVSPRLALAQGKTAKAPVPSEADQAKASQLIKEVYHDEYANADSLGAKQALAKKLLEKARETQDDLVAKYVLLRIARDVATQGLDGLTAFYAIDNWQKPFT